MAYATEVSTRTQSGLNTRIATMLTNFREHRTRRKVYLRTFRELAALTDRELSDLGLGRSEIRRVAYQAAYEV